MEKYCYYCMGKLPEDGACGCERSVMGAQASIPGALPPGTVLNGKYLIGFPLGAGGFGITYIGRDLNLDMKIAVKEYTEGAEGGKERFLREARAMARFSGQTGIVNVRDFFEANGTAYIVMEYLEGITLKEYITKFGPVSWELALRYMAPVLTVLGKIHAEGFIHRDVSPDNIMMLKDGSVKLLDFGSAADVGSGQQRTMTVMLKPGYAPPEQYQGKGGMGPWTDVYGACATLYKCVTGETPPDSLSRMFEDTLKFPPQPGNAVPPYGQEALLHGMAVRREERTASVEQLMLELSGHGKERQDEVGQKERQEEAVWKAEKTAGGKKDHKAADDYTKGQKAADGRKERLAGGQNEQKAADGYTKQQPGAARGGAAAQKRAAQKKPKAKGRSTKEAKASGGKKNKKVLWLSLAGAAAVLFCLCLVLIFSGKIGNANPYREGNDSISHLKDLTVTDKMIDIISHDEETTGLSLSNCVITEEQLERLAKNQRITRLSLNECSGFTSLNALANMVSLQVLSLDVGDGGSLDGSALFSTAFNYLGQLNLYSNVVLTTGTDFLEQLPSLQALHMDGAKGVENLNFIKSMPNLRSLSISDVALGDKDYSALSAGLSLERLSAENTGINNLTVLSGCVNLAELSLSGCGITDITPLAGLTNMISLRLKNNQITDLTPLAAMTKMSALYLSGNQIADVSPLAGMTGMLDLYIDNNQITTLAPLAAMTDILNINARNNQLQNLDGCQAMIDLMGFWAANNQLTDVNGIKGCTSLKTLDLQNNQLSDVSMLGNGFTELWYINLANNQISDISGLAASSKLRAVVVENNLLTSLAGVENKPELKGIMANNNQITDISALGTSMDSLQYIDLGTNQISDISVFSKLAYKQTALLLENNQITDISVLPSSLNYKLVVYGNPITDYSPVSLWTNIDTFRDGIYIDYNGNADLTPLLEAGFGAHFYIVDAPLDQQAAILRQTESVWKPEFITKDMADAAMAEYRDEIRADLGGEPDDGESGQ